MQIQGVQVSNNPLDIFTRHSFIRIDILPVVWWGKWKRRHGILEASQKSELQLAAEMAYIMEFMTRGGLLPLAQLEDLRKMPISDGLTTCRTALQTDVNCCSDYKHEK